MKNTLQESLSTDEAGTAFTTIEDIDPDEFSSEGSNQIRRMPKGSTSCLDRKTVDEYALQLLAEARRPPQPGDFPPITAYRIPPERQVEAGTDKKYLIRDGHHRMAALLKARKMADETYEIGSHGLRVWPTLNARILNEPYRSKDDILFKAWTDNKKNGLSMGTYEKKAAFKAWLRCEGYFQDDRRRKAMTLRKVGELFCIDHKTVPGWVLSFGKEIGKPDLLKTIWKRSDTEYLLEQQAKDRATEFRDAAILKKQTITEQLERGDTSGVEETLLDLHNKSYDRECRALKEMIASGGHNKARAILHVITEKHVLFVQAIKACEDSRTGRNKVRGGAS